MLVEASVDFVGHVWGNVDRLVSDLKRDAATVARDSQAVYTDAVTTCHSVQDAWRSVPRVTRVVTEGLRIAAAYRVMNARVSHLPTAEAEQKMNALHRRSAERVYDMCVELRGPLLKLGQFLSCRMDLLPEPWIDALSRLQDQVPALPAELIEAEIVSALGKSPDDLFKSWSKDAIAAASLGQVHAATLHDGTSVVVKVRIPGVDALVDADLTAMRVLAQYLGDLLPAMDLDTIVTELDGSLRRELNYVEEAKNLREFSRCFADNERIVVPVVYSDFSAETVLTLSRIEGERLVDFLDGCEQRGPDGLSQRDELMGLFVEAVSAQVLEHGLMHADPHPGNFLVCSGVRLAVLDFGAVQRFSAAERRGYAGLVRAVLSRDSKAIAEQFELMGFATQTGDTAALLELADFLLEMLATDSTFDALEINAMAQIQRAIAIAGENPVVTMPQSMVQLGRVLGATGGLMLRYKPRINVFAITGPYFAKLWGNPGP